MTSRPILTNGILRQTSSGWVVQLSEGDASFEEGMPVRLTLWDEREASSKSEVERIATVQQLDPAIIALALSAEGAL